MHLLNLRQTVPANSRIGDVFAGVCCCKPHKHCVNVTGIIISGCKNATSKNSGNAGVGDVGVGTCGHPTIIISGSKTVTVNHKANARVGDAVAGCINGVLITGDKTTTNNN